MPVNLKSLISKTDDSTRKALEDAAGLCLANTHYNVEVEHFLFKLLDQQDNDLHHIAKYFNIDTSRLKTELGRALEANRRGNASTPSFGLWLEKMLTSAWTTASLEFSAAQIRSGFCLLALVSDDDLRRVAYEIGPELQLIDAPKLLGKFNDIVAGSPEQTTSLSAQPAAAGRSAASAPGSGKTPNLDQFTINLTENARQGKVDNVLGRDFEIRQIVDILTRRRQNNPILTGEAGVGKTAVVEGFALRVSQGDVPPPLRNVEVRTLDMALLQAGAGIKGEFENRLKSLVEEVKRSPRPIILFIDEAHTMIGAGAQAGQGDVANILKPALARGELRTIAATTWSEYKKYFEKDPALARRFQVVKVEEPSGEQCLVMMRGIIGVLEKHHKVRILDEAVAAAVKLSHRYIAGRQLPDKAVSVLDTACARLALGHNSTPAAIEDLQRQMDDLDVQERILRRESATGIDHAERLQSVVEKKAAAAKSFAEINAKWEQVSTLVEEIREVRGKLENLSGVAQSAAPASSSETAAATQISPTVDGDTLRRQLADLNHQLDILQGETPLLQVCVDGHIVGQVISGWTGIPLGKMISDEIGTVLALDQHLAKRVIGQDYPLKLIGQRIQTGRASLDDPGKPLGVFMLIGPSGVGKTETALALSDLLYGGEHNLITINMSEFQEAHTVSTLKGSPPGYVGYGEGGVLTEAVRRRPYSVVLLDEVEKAHPDVLEVFYQVFDKGRMEDGEGREIDFKNTIIILTTNACTDQMTKLTSDPAAMPGPEALVKTLKPELNKIFKPAFLGRMVIIPFYPIRDEVLKKIIELKLGRIQRRMLENHKIELKYDPAVVDEVAKRCTEVESGARNVDNILTNTLLPDISRQLLTSIAAGRKLSSVTVAIGTDGSFQYS
jgi:type VI secretion system protein VasG